MDAFLFGGDSLIPYLSFPRFSFHRLDVTEVDLTSLMDGVDVVYHLAALVGFPACQAAGETAAFRFNFEATKRVFDAAERAGVRRFVFASTYSNYGVAPEGELVTEDSPLVPQSLYARTKIAAENYLRERAPLSACSPIIPRFATLFGISPRTRFDLLVNQFVMQALTERRLVLFQGDFRRSFVHVRDIVRALRLFAEAPLERVRGEVFNVGADGNNHTKSEIIAMVCGQIPGVEVERRDLSFGSDMRDVAISCRKIEERLGFSARLTVQDGIREVREAIASGLIADPRLERYRDHSLIVP